MATMRLMDAPEDYARLGINPDHVEVWEDRRRSEQFARNKAAWEWWYFDSILDDGTKLVIQFLTTDQKGMTERTNTPNVMVTITDPDGTRHTTRPTFKPDQASYADNHCDVRFGPDRFQGDLQHYTIHVEQSDGISADVRLTSYGRPFRPGTAYFGFGDHDEHYYTWLCVVPTGEVTGTLTVDGQAREIHGSGYHDHQWGTINLALCWNHWMWSRQGFDDYAILVFDMVSHRDYGYKRFPLCFIEDGDGNLVFENTREISSFAVADEFHDGGKDYPKDFRYVFEKDGTTVSYSLHATEQIERVDVAAQGKELMAARLGKAGSAVLGGLVMKKMRKEFEKYNLQPSYARYAADGDLSITREGQETVERSGHLIYEFMYPGASPYREHV